MLFTGMRGRLILRSLHLTPGDGIMLIGGRGMGRSRYVPGATTRVGHRLLVASNGRPSVGTLRARELHHGQEKGHQHGEQEEPGACQGVPDDARRGAALGAARGVLSRTHHRG